MKRIMKLMNEKYMREALKEAKKAIRLGEVPIGCVIVYQDKIIGRGYNKRNTRKTTLAHAELIAIEKASKAMGDWRLEECVMYVTLEPCPMCAGAIINARISEVYYGARDDKAGCCGSVLNLFEERFNHRPRLVGGVLKDECSSQLKDFFENLRKECE
jgi:tRNA(adenine34) deaminase